MLYIPGFTRIGLGIRKFGGGGGFTGSEAHRKHGDLTSLLLFFQNGESRVRARILKPE
jgi:hypothetical protein